MKKQLASVASAALALLITITPATQAFATDIAEDEEFQTVGTVQPLQKDSQDDTNGIKKTDNNNGPAETTPSELDAGDDTDAPSTGVTASDSKDTGDGSEPEDGQNAENVQRGNKKYSTIKEALSENNNTEDGTEDIIKLLNDIESEEEITIGKEKKITIDLNGHTYTRRGDGKGSAFVVNGELTLKNSGSAGALNDISADYNSRAIKVGDTGKVTIDNTAVVKGQIFVVGVEKTNDTVEQLEGGKLIMNGTVDTTGKTKKYTYTESGQSVTETYTEIFGICGNGLRHGTNITVNGKVYSDGTAIYHPQYGTLTINNGADIKGKDAGIELRAGNLIMNGGTVSGTGSPAEVTANGNGTTSSGAGIAIAQHTTKLQIDVKISEGTVKGYSAFFESNPQGNDEIALEKIKLNITGGTFDVINGGTVAVYSKDCTGFIEGGKFMLNPNNPTGSSIIIGSYIDKKGYTIDNSGDKYISDIKDNENTKLSRDGKYLLVGENAINADIESNNQSTTSSGGSSSGSSTKVVKNEDGSTTSTKKLADGTVREETKKTDGSVVTVDTKKDGSVTTTNKAADGTTGTIITDASGAVTDMQTEFSANAVAQAAESGNALTLPMTLTAAASTEQAATVKVSAKTSAESLKVEIPVQDVTNTTVIINAKTGEIIKVSAVDENGVVIKLDGQALADGAELKVVNNAKNLPDAQNHWAKDSIDFVTSREIFNGTSKDKFTPEGAMTRMSLMTVLARLENGDDANAIEWAKQKGISDGSNPNAAINREQLVTMLYRYVGSPKVDGSFDNFADAGKVSNYAADAMAWAIQTGLISGTGNGSLAPQGGATRAQTATIIMRFCANIVK